MTAASVAGATGSGKPGGQNWLGTGAIAAGIWRRLSQAMIVSERRRYSGRRAAIETF